MGRRFTISLLIILHETSIPSSVESVSCCYMNIFATMTFFLHMSIAIVHTPLKLSDADVGLAQGIKKKAFFHGTSPYIYIYTHRHTIMFVGSFFPAIKHANLWVLWVEFLPPGARRRNHLQGDSRNLGQDSRNKHPWQEYGLQKWGKREIMCL